MTTQIRMTHSTAMVLQALSSGRVYGFDIMELTGLPGGTVYPALRRLEAAEMVESEWEEGAVAQERGRPARKYYRLTEPGRVALREAAGRFRVVGMLEANADGAGS
jgi:DNA-binding PadR family transcriptional regulator